jgi:hypothetical protein
LRLEQQSSPGDATRVRYLLSSEDTVLKHLSICIALIAVATGSLSAQQREAIPQNSHQRVATSKMEVPGADFDIIFVTTESRAGVTDDLDSQPDPLAYAGLRTRVYLVPKGETLALPER